MNGANLPRPDIYHENAQARGYDERHKRPIQVMLPLTGILPGVAGIFAGYFFTGALIIIISVLLTVLFTAISYPNLWVGKLPKTQHLPNEIRFAKFYWWLYKRSFEEANGIHNRGGQSARVVSFEKVSTGYEVLLVMQNLSHIDLWENARSGMRDYFRFLGVRRVKVIDLTEGEIKVQLRQREPQNESKSIFKGEK